MVEMRTSHSINDLVNRAFRFVLSTEPRVLLLPGRNIPLYKHNPGWL